MADVRSKRARRINRAKLTLASALYVGLGRGDSGDKSAPTANCVTIFAGGVEFIAENGGGVGVTMRKASE
jgi:hypothetical protein